VKAYKPRHYEGRTKVRPFVFSPIPVACPSRLL
jgi:hypothetical protein